MGIRPGHHPIALAGRGRFVAHGLSEHTRTNIEIVKRFLETRIEATEIQKDQVELRFGEG